MRSAFAFLLFIIVLGLVGIFVFQNSDTTTIYFFQWSVELTTGVLVLFALLAGILLGVLWFLPGLIVRNLSIR